MVSRRRMLQTALALAMAGCGRRPTRTSGGNALVVRVLSTPRPLQHLDFGILEYYTTVPHLMAAFNAAHTRIRVVTAAEYVSGTESVYSLEGVGANDISYAVAQPLNAALRMANFATSRVPPGFLRPFQSRGQLSGLPVSQTPLGVRWRTDVFETLGLPAPQAGWTMDDFELACLRVDAAIRSGRAPRLVAPLCPVNGTPVSLGLIANPAFWMAFVLGYGGSVSAAGRFAPDARAAQGLSVLVDTIRRYSPPSRWRPWLTTGNLGQISGRAALAFDFWTPRGVFTPAPAFDARWAWARLPRFPVRPVITTLVNGEGLTTARRGQPPRPDQLNLAVQALLWLDEPPGRSLLQAWGAVPVLGGAEAQKRFWELQARDVRVVGEWTNFVPYDSGWPSGGAWMAGRVSRAMVPALLQAVSGTETLHATLAHAVRHVNG